MSNKETFEYAVIRLVPKVEREEFLNIGIILFSKRNKFLKMKYHLDKDRIKAFAKDLDVNMIEEYLRAWQFICEGNLEGGKIAELEQSFRFRWLAAAKSTIVQTSPTHSGLCENPEKLLNELMALFVLEESID